MPIAAHLYLWCRCCVVRGSSWEAALYRPRLVSEGTCVLSSALPACHYLRISAGLHPLWCGHLSHFRPIELQGRIEGNREPNNESKRNRHKQESSSVLPSAAAKLPVMRKIGKKDWVITTAHMSKHTHIWTNAHMTIWPLRCFKECTYAFLHAFVHTYIYSYMQTYIYT